jgi:hypothetical protein
MKTVNEKDGKDSINDLTLDTDEKPRRIKDKYYSAKHGEAIEFVHDNGRKSIHWT